MFKLIKKSKKKLSKMQHGQVLVVVAFAIVGIVAVMGLALDVGTMLIEYGRLRRAVDSAALAAALQIRQGYDPANLAPAARDFLKLNGFDTTSVTVEYCDLLTNTPADLCPTPPRKLVRVTAAATAQLNFLAVIGITSVPIAATATSQTASIDMVLVIDRSESMTYNSVVGQLTNDVQMRDPSVCNVAATSPQGYTGDCEPFNTVKDSAIKFVNQFMFEPYDRVAVVTFDKDPHVNLPFTSVKATVISTIAALTVYQGDESVGVPPGVYPNGNPSRYYDPVANYLEPITHIMTYYGPPDNPNGRYLGFNCPMALIPDDASNPFHLNPSHCTTTNLGGGLLDAAQAFSTPPIRPSSLWVVVLLTDGVANAGYDTSTPPTYFCPPGTWIGDTNPPLFCNDGTTDIIPANRHSPMASPNFDAEDYAYYEADAVGLDTAHGGQNAYLYTIGLGSAVIAPSPVDGTPLGQNFLQYAATVGNGKYYRAPTATDLGLIFQSIANNIATVLTK